MMTQIVFSVMAASAVVCALACILQRNPVAAAMWLVGTMFSLAGIYVLLNAQFIGAIQILVYAGAIMVLFLFVIMLLNLGHNASDLRRWPALGLAAGVSTALLTTLAGLRFYTPARLAAEVAGASTSQDPARVLTGGTAAQSAMDSLGVVGAIADPLFRTYLVPFEITSVLLLTAAVGAVVIAKRRI